jgi:hypothetical protein
MPPHHLCQHRDDLWTEMKTEMICRDEMISAAEEIATKIK